MEQVQTIVCPNCGAVTASNQNCEYCGSMLTKVATALCKEGDDVKASLKDLGFGKSAYVSNNILQAVERTIAQCNKHNTVIETYTAITGSKHVGLDIRKEIISHWLKLSKTDRSLLGMVAKDPLSMSIISSTPNTPPVLMLKYYMMCREVNRSYSYFENSSIGELFNKQQVGDFMVCTMELDSDSKTSAQLIKYILKKHGCTEVNREFNTFVEIDNVKYEISTEKKKKNDEDIEWNEKNYMNQVLKEQASYISNIKRESILPSFKQIFGLVAGLAMCVYLGKMFTLTTALIILGAVITLSMIVEGVYKSHRINEVRDLETFKTKYSKIKHPNAPSDPDSLYTNIIEE